jgi:putative cardiolipin synthase
VVLDSPELAKELAAWFDDDVERFAWRLRLKTNYYGSRYIEWTGVVDGETKTYYADPGTGFLQRFGLNLLGILPIENQL